MLYQDIGFICFVSAYQSTQALLVSANL